MHTDTVAHQDKVECHVTPLFEEGEPEKHFRNDQGTADNERTPTMTGNHVFHAPGNVNSK